MAERVGLLILLPFLGFLLNGALAFLKPKAKGVVTAIGVGSVALSFALAAGIFGVMVGAHAEHPFVKALWTWMPVGNLDLSFALQVDNLSIVMALVVTGVGSLIHIFSVGYMHEDPGYARYFAYLNLFIAFMLTLVLGASFPVLFIGWEGVGLCSYLLIGFWFTDQAKAEAGLKAFLVNRIGDAGFLIAMFLLWRHLGTLTFVGVNEAAPRELAFASGTVTAIALLLFLGCAGKSAQIPLYTWLPDAMAGPTPVSALIHAATMVTAGVFLVARAGVLFAMSPVAQMVVAGVGALTALFAASIGLKQWDIKKVLAYSTVSQLGYMFVGVGTGAYAAGIFHLTTHAFFKALLFLGSGSVIHAMHAAYHHTHNTKDAQDMRNMGGLRQLMPTTFRTMWIAWLAIAGIFPLAGFFSKDEILLSAFARGAHDPFWYLVWLVGVAAALLTAYYMTRLMLYTFEGGNRTGDHERPHLHESPAVMTVPLIVLAVLTVAGGMINLPGFLPGGGWLHHWLEPVTQPAVIASGSETHASFGFEIGLMVLALAIAVFGIWYAYRTLTPRLATAAEPVEEKGFARLVAEKYRVDEIYDTFVVRPVVWISRNVLWKGVDVGAIDSAGVNGSAVIARTLGWIGTRLQTGVVGTYVFLFVLGALAVLGALIR
ncbi:MAG: NADH-quinone oxidoreductase subunit L [Gemmatimonadetes bacterium GWC2_71_10]|nr:MAG: NADH-quinone oxidoreductase subunit L [Gemmatimonadetes bacterium GWC2_71_10]